MVNFSTTDGTATAGRGDYLLNNGALTFPEESTTQTVSIIVNGDNLHEFDETFFVNLTNSTNATIAKGQGLGIIINDDFPIPPLFTFDKPLPNDQAFVCLPPFMVQDPSVIHDWWALATSSGNLEVTLVAFSVNSAERGSVTIRVFNPSGSLVGMATINHPTIQDTEASAPTIKVRVNDGFVSTIAEATVNVKNVAPTVSIINAPATSPEGAAISLNSTVTDPSSADTSAGLTYAWSVTKNGNPFASAPTPNFNFTPDDNGTDTVTNSHQYFVPGTYDERVSSGLYFYTIQAGEYTATRKMSLLK